LPFWLHCWPGGQFCLLRHCTQVPASLHQGVAEEGPPQSLSARHCTHRLLLVLHNVALPAVQVLLSTHWTQT
jgi:hypothetical protein